MTFKKLTESLKFIACNCVVWGKDENNGKAIISLQSSLVACKTRTSLFISVQQRIISSSPVKNIKIDRFKGHE